MESAIRGLVLDSSVLVAAERAKLTTPEVLRNIRASVDVGDVPIVISPMRFIFAIPRAIRQLLRCGNVCT